MIIACPVIKENRVIRNDELLDLVHFSDELIIAYAFSVGILAAPYPGVQGDLTEVIHHWESNTDLLDPEQDDAEATLLYHIDAVTQYLFLMLDEYIRRITQQLGPMFYLVQHLLRTYGFTVIRITDDLCLIVVRDNTMPDINQPLFASQYEQVIVNPPHGEVAPGSGHSGHVPAFGPQTYRSMAHLHSSPRRFTIRRR